MNKFIVTEIKKNVYAVMANSHEEALNCVTEPDHYAEKGIYATLIEVEGEMTSELS